MAQSRYCKVYVNGAVRPEDLTLLLLGAFGGERDTRLRHIRSPVVQIDVCRNDGRVSPGVALGEHERFLHFPHCLDVDAPVDVPHADYVAAVAKLLQALWGAGLEAVAACDFEDDLPRHGGRPWG
jgi:hypothetical protein